ncbi:MAG TPA: metallophosphoesterase, partial [Abditibacteriaceae bacterium]
MREPKFQYDEDYEIARPRERHRSGSTTVDRTARGEHDSSGRERRPKSTTEKGKSLLAKAACVLGPLYSMLYDLQMQIGGGVRTVTHRVQLPGIARATPTLRAVFMSDLHLGPSSGRVAASQAWQIARDAEPDLLLLGGDYLWADMRGLPALVRELQRWKWIRPKAGIFAILGNHDYDDDVQTIIDALENCGVRVLRNGAAQLPEPWDNVWISGLDDIDHAQPDIGIALENVP